MPAPEQSPHWFWLLWVISPVPSHSGQSLIPDPRHVGHFTWSATARSVTEKRSNPNKRTVKSFAFMNSAFSSKPNDYPVFGIVGFSLLNFAKCSSQANFFY
jgi:hypothetical protein